MTHRLRTELDARFGPPPTMPAGLAATLGQLAGHAATAPSPPPSSPPSSLPSSPIVAAATDRRRSGVVGRLRMIAIARPLPSIAAAVAMILLGGWLALRFGPGTSALPAPYDTGPFRPATAVFAARLDDGFAPDWVCEDDAEFRAITERLHGQALSMGDPLADVGGVRMLGVAASHTFSRRTLNVLVRIDGRPAMVVIDRRDRIAARPHALGTVAEVADPALHVHRRRIGELEMVELSPFPAPRALSRFGPAGEPGR